MYYGTKAGVWVSIDGMHIVDTRIATIELIRGNVMTAMLQRERGEPVGIFSPTGACYMNEETDARKHIPAYREGKILPINYGTILSDDLQQILQSRLASVRDRLRDPDTEIKCIRGVPQA